MNSRNLFLRVLESVKSTTKVLADLVSGENPVLAHKWLPSPSVLTQRKGQENIKFRVRGPSVKGH